MPAEDMLSRMEINYGDLAESVQVLRERVGDRSNAAAMALNLALTYGRLDRWGDALATAVQARDELIELGDREASFASCHVAYCLRHLGRELAVREEEVQRGRRLAEGIDSPVYGLVLDIEHVHALVERGEDPAALLADIEARLGMLGATPSYIQGPLDEALVAARGAD